jgi:hypothetical protein
VWPRPVTCCAGSGNRSVGLSIRSVNSNRGCPTLAWGVREGVASEFGKLYVVTGAWERKGEL